MSEPATLPAPGELFADRFQIECGLGGGFESQVLGAIDRETGRRVAIKCWTGDHAEQAVASVRAFMRLAYESGLYEHPNLLEVFTAEFEHGTGYCVTEWLEGSTLARQLTQSRPAPLQDVFEHVLPCMRAIAEAHAAGIVHGDIRPGHIFLCRATRHRPARPQVFDFGRGMPGFQELRALKRPTLDSACHYTSPEQLQSALVDARSDQYGFGLLLYEMLAGELPFTADNGNDLALEIVAGAARPLAELRPSLPPGLSEIVARAMAVDPDERFEDLLGLIAALEPFDPRYASGASIGLEQADYRVRLQPAYSAPGLDAYDWSFQESSEPRPVMIPAAEPQRSQMFLPRAALAGAITAAVISAVYLDDGLFERLSFQSQTSRGHEQHSMRPSAPPPGAPRPLAPDTTETSYSAIEHTDGPLPGALPGPEVALPDALAVQATGAAMAKGAPSAATLPPGLAAPSSNARRELGSAPPSVTDLAALDLPQSPPSAERTLATKTEAALAPRPAVSPDAALKPAPASAPERSSRRRRVNPQEAIQRLDDKLLLQ